MSKALDIICRAVIIAVISGLAFLGFLAMMTGLHYLLYCQMCWNW